MTLDAIKSAFGGCKRIDSSICAVPSPFEVVSLSDFYIFDEKGEHPVRVVELHNDHQLIVKNNSEQEITLIKRINAYLLMNIKNAIAFYLIVKKYIL